jgi:prepilin-type N-terminal cleavage/methylation domain-containing protein
MRVVYPKFDYRWRAFTLIEVMVALVIVGLAGIVLVASYVNVLNAYASVNQATAKTEDVRFARAQLLTQADRTKAEQGDNFDLPGGGRATWKATIEETEVADLFHVTFNCEISGAAEKGEDGTTTESFMLLRPTWSVGDVATKLKQAAKDKITQFQQQRVP